MNDYALFRCNMGCAFDERFHGGSIGLVIWNTSRIYLEENPGMEINVVLPLSGKLDDIVRDYGAVERPDLRFSYEIPFALNPDVWRGPFAEIKTVALTTRVYEFRHEGIHFFFLSNEYEDSCGEYLYPMWSYHGNNIYFYKQLIYQYDAYRFIRHFPTPKKKIVHVHDINNAYLLVTLLSALPEVRTISSIHDGKLFENAVYAKLLQRICAHEGLTFPPGKRRRLSGLPGVIDYGNVPAEFSNGDYLYRKYFLPHHLAYRFGNVLTCDSPGHFAYMTSYRESPLQEFYSQDLERLVTPLVRSGRLRTMTLGIFDDWFRLAAEPAEEKDDFQGITFIHNSRWDPYHKGQFELIEAAEILLRRFVNVRFIFSLVIVSLFEYKKVSELAREFPDRVIYIREEFGGKKIPKREIAALLRKSDFFLAPSHRNLDSFSFSIGEAMLFGVVPMISDQAGLSHWTAPFEDREELLLPSVNRDDDRRLMLQALVDKITRILQTFDREKINALKARAKEVAAGYSIRDTARNYLRLYQELADERSPSRPNVGRRHSPATGAQSSWK